MESVKYEVYLWGSNDHAQVLGSSKSKIFQKPTAISMDTFRQEVSLIGCGPLFSFVYSSQDSMLYLWGKCKNLLPDLPGESSSSSNGVSTMYVKEPTTMNLSNFGAMKTISSGSDFIVTLSENGKLYSWGNTKWGCLGIGDRVSEPFIQTPLFVDFGKPQFITSLACGLNHVCAVNITGQVFSWGMGADGRLGYEATEIQKIPKLIEDLEGKGVIDVSCGQSHSLALSSNGEVYSWGKSEYGCLGDGNSDHIRITPEIVDMKGVFIRAISCGRFHNVVLGPRDSVFSWGSGQQGQLGVNLMSSSVPNEIPGLKKGANIISVTCGLSHSFAIDEIGYLWAWGSSKYGQLGTGRSLEEYTPICLTDTILDSKFILKVVAGDKHTIALVRNRTKRDEREEQYIVGKDQNVHTEEYTITRIVGKKRISGIINYRVEWEGYTKKSWEPITNLKHATKLINEFEKNLSETGQNEINDESDDEVSQAEKRHHFKQKTKKEETEDTIETHKESSNVTESRESGESGESSESSDEDGAGGRRTVEQMRKKRKKSSLAKLKMKLQKSEKNKEVDKEVDEEGNDHELIVSDDDFMISLSESANPLPPLKRLKKKENKFNPAKFAREENIDDFDQPFPSIPLKDSQSDEEESESEWEVEEIVDKKKRKNQVLYLVKWVGWEHSANTWEPISHLLNCQNLIEEFENNQKQKKKDQNEDGSHQSKSVDKLDSSLIHKTTTTTTTLSPTPTSTPIHSKSSTPSNTPSNTITKSTTKQNSFSSTTKKSDSDSAQPTMSSTSTSTSTSISTPSHSIPSTPLNNNTQKQNNSTQPTTKKTTVASPIHLTQSFNIPIKLFDINKNDSESAKKRTLEQKLTSSHTINRSTPTTPFIPPTVTANNNDDNNIVSSQTKKFKTTPSNTSLLNVGSQTSILNLYTKTNKTPRDDDSSSTSSIESISSKSIEKKSKVPAKKKTLPKEDLGFKWGSELNRVENKQFYRDFIFNGVSYKQGDIVTLVVDENVCFGVITHLWENNNKSNESESDQHEMLMRWFYRERDLSKKLQNQLKKFENCVVLSKKHYDVNPITVIEGKCSDIEITREHVKFTWNNEELICPCLLYNTQNKSLEKIKDIGLEMSNIVGYSEICDE